MLMTRKLLQRAKSIAGSGKKKTKAFLAIYEPFVRKHTVKLKDNLEEIVDFSKGQGCTSDNFFQMYHNYFTVR